MLSFNSKILNLVILCFLSVVIMVAGVFILITQEGPALRGGDRVVGPETIPVGILFVGGGACFLVMSIVKYVKSKQ